MAAHNVRFPDDISYGSKGGPGFSTNVLELDSGAEQRIVRWDGAKRQYDVAYGVKTKDQMSLLLTFITARDGAAHSFRFKDFTDFTTHTNHRDTPAFTDVTIAVGDGSATSFQLTKKYTNGGVTRTRTISKPIAASVLVGINGSQQMSGWTVDDTTGILTFTTPPTAGHPITWGGEYDVPVRFTKEAEAALKVDIATFGTWNVPSIPLVEVLDAAVAIDDEFPHGGAYETTFSANMTISFLKGRLQVLSATTGSLAASLPNPSSIPPGDLRCFVVNKGSNTFALKDHLGTTLVNLAQNTGAWVLLTVDSGGTKVWGALS